MKIKFYKQAELEKDIKLSVHRTGRLGFSVEAAKKMSLSQDKSADIGYDEDEPEGGILYIVINDNKNGEFPVVKAGSYYYLNTKILFDNLKIDYSNGDVVFDMKQVEIDGSKMYSLKRNHKPSVVNSAPDAVDSLPF